ncbi:MAG: response regulator [Microbacterium sp.]|uniref:response regulator transcription factor n=1 Tax=Microbacterium sp. TaxID=51671 RepID=UPI0039E2F927
MARILVVEDDADVAELIRFRLTASGHLVLVASDGEEGIVAARVDAPDLVILDWMMPRKNGIEVCTELRADARFERTRILMLTARAKEADIASAYAAGVDDYVTKPFSPRELLARVQRLIV